MALYYELLDENVEIDDVLKRGHPSTSKYLKSVPVLHSGYKSLKDWFFNTLHPTEEQPPATIRSCTGIVEYLSRVVVVKFPYDVLLRTKVNGEFAWRTCCDSPGFNIESHQEFQYQSPNEKLDMFRDLINIKITLPFKISSDKKVRLIFADPYYHKRQPYSVMPGSVTLAPDYSITLPINTFVPRKDDTYYFKAGDPVCYLQFDSDDINLEPEIQKRKFGRNIKILGGKDTYKRRVVD